MSGRKVEIFEAESMGAATDDPLSEKISVAKIVAAPRFSE